MKKLFKKRYFFLLLLILFVVEMFREFTCDPQDFSYYAKRISGNVWLEPYHDYYGPTEDSLIFTSQNSNYIPVRILDYRNNDTLIVVKQKWLKDKKLSAYYAKGRDYPPSEDSIYYWIILVPVDSFIGPLTYDSISILYNYYNIDESLRL